MIDVARHMPAVAELLLGQPNPAYSSDGEWRFGSRGSLAIDISAGRWFDHEHGTGGGVLDLINREKHCGRAQAMAWLLENIPDAAEEAAAEARPNGQAGKTKPPLGRIVAVYDYQSEHGELLFQVVRFEPKDFRQRRPDPSARDGWSWKVKGVVEPVPYRLPALLTAKAVVVTEGERDADRLVAAGFVATTNPGGAGKWPKAFGPWFAGKAVAILPDHDDAGRKHTQDVARSLAGHASQIKVVDLPGLPPKGDVSDWLDAGGTAEALEALIDAAPPWASDDGTEWDDPLDIVGAPELVGWPTLGRNCLPEPLFRYVMAEAERLNVDPCPLAAHVIAACATSISDRFTVKPKMHATSVVEVVVVHPVSPPVMIARAKRAVCPIWDLSRCRSMA